jgi:hypothetical protein
MLTKCTEKVGFFVKMLENNETDKHEECCKFMNYSFFKKNEVVFAEGSIGQEFFIILKGSVTIYKQQAVEMEGEEPLELNSPGISGEDPNYFGKRLGK